MFGQFFGKHYFGDAWFGPDDGSQPVVADKPVDGSGLIITRRRRKAQAVKPIDQYRTPEDIRREQLETERYLASIEKAKPQARIRDEAPALLSPAPAVAPNPILADVAARAASAVQEKIEEADSAAALVLLAKQQRHRTLVLLLALD